MGISVRMNNASIVLTYPYPDFKSGLVKPPFL